jgi:hypothetical protein
MPHRAAAHARLDQHLVDAARRYKGDPLVRPNVATPMPGAEEACMSKFVEVGGLLVAVIAVVVSLYQLRREIGHNTVALRAASYNEMVGTSISLITPLFLNSDGFTDLYRTKTGQPADVDDLRWHFFMVVSFRHFDNLLYQHRQGALGDDMWQTYRNAIAVYVRQAPYADWFARNQTQFSLALRELVTELQE